MNRRERRSTVRVLRDAEREEAAPARIVVADDSTSLRAVVRVTVETQGWIVLEAATGAATLALVRERPPDLLLLDLDFGTSGPDGLEVLRIVRAEPATAAVPVVILTATDRADVRARALGLGATEFLTKPFGPLDLIATMRAVLGRKLEEPRLGLHLVQSGALTSDQLRLALDRQRERERAGKRITLGALLIELGMISRAELDMALRRQGSQTGR